MRRLCTLFAIMAAAGLSAQTATTDERPQLIHSVEVQPGDSPLVQAAKRAVARRQSAKDRITVAVTSTGHISQPPGPAKAMKMPPDLPVPSTPAAIDPNVIRARNEEIERRIRILQEEQDRLGAAADQPYAGDGSEEDDIQRRRTTIQQKIDELRRQQKEASKPPQG